MSASELNFINGLAALGKFDDLREFLLLEATSCALRFVVPTAVAQQGHVFRDQGNSPAFKEYLLSSMSIYRIPPIVRKEDRFSIRKMDFC